ncbi:Ras-GAP domain-containing protein [Entamoeba marina]
MSRKSLFNVPPCEILSAQQIIDKIDSFISKDEEKDYSVDDLNTKILPLLHEIMHRINSTVPICYTTDEVLSSNFRARWVILTEKGIKYLKQALTSYIKAYSGVKHDLNSSLVRLRFVFYLFDKVEQHLKIAICDPIPENDTDKLFDFKKLTKAISSFEKVVLTCYSFDKKKISKISDLKKLDHVVFTHQSKKKGDKQQLAIIIPYIKELFAFRSLFKAQLDMAYRDNSAEEQGVNYSNVLIEGYAITFPFKNKKLVPADVFSEMLFALFDCHQDEEYKEYPDDPYEISQTIMNIIFFWYQNYNEDFQSFYADEILQFMNNYCVQHFDVECVNVNLANKRIELQKKNKSIKVHKKKIKLCYINENVVADTLTEIDAYLYFKIPISAYLSNSQLSQFSKDYFIEAISEIEERKRKYASFVKRLIDIDTNEAYQYFIGLCAALVYRCHNYFAAFTILSVLVKTLSEANNKSSLNSLEKNVKNQYDDLLKLFPVLSSVENLKNFNAISNFGDPYIHDPLLMQAKGSDLVLRTTMNLTESEIPSEYASTINAFVKEFETSKIHFLNKPKTRVESVRPIIGFDLLEYLFKLPADENEEMVLAHYDKPTQVTVKKKITFIAIDGSEYDELIYDYNIESFPHIIFHRGTLRERVFTGEKLSELQSFINDCLLPIVIEITNPLELNHYKKQAQITYFVLYVTNNTNPLDIEEFVDVADVLQEYTEIGFFIASGDASVNTTDPFELIYYNNKAYDDIAEVIPYSNGQIQDWMFTISFPLFEEVNTALFSIIDSLPHKLPIFWYFTKQATTKIKHEITSLARTLRGKLLFVYCGEKDTMNHLEQTTFKTATILHPNRRTIYPFNQTQVNTIDKISDISMQYLNNQINPLIKSTSKGNYSIEKLTGNEFHNGLNHSCDTVIFVIDNSLVSFNFLQREYLAITKRIQHHVKVFHFNIETDDAPPDLIIPDAPTVLFFPATNKTHFNITTPLTFTYYPNQDVVVEFITKHTTTPLQPLPHIDENTYSPLQEEPLQEDNKHTTSHKGKDDKKQKNNQQIEYDHNEFIRQLQGLTEYQDNPIIKNILNEIDWKTLFGIDVSKLDGLQDLNELDGVIGKLVHKINKKNKKKRRSKVEL